MKLKWDQGLASRGKLKGLRTFAPTDADTTTAREGQTVLQRQRKTKWIDYSNRKPIKKRKRSESIECDEVKEVVQPESRAKPNTCRSNTMALALIAPEVPVISVSPTAPVPFALKNIENARLFNYYLNHVCRVTVVTDTDKNPFRTIICPMSLESPLIMSSVLAIAAANLSHTSPEYKVISYKHLNDALSRLKDRLSDPATALTEISLAGVLAQVSCQLHHGNVTDWRVHLTAARGIVNALGGPKAVLKARPDWKFYVQHLAWLDTLASTTYSSQKAGKSDYWNALIESIRGAKLGYSMQDLMGCSEDLLEIIADMTRKFDEEVETRNGAIAEPLGAAHDSVVPSCIFPSKDVPAQVRALLGEQYSQKLDALCPLITPHDSATALAEVFRLSALIYLNYRIMHSTCWSQTLQRLLHEAIELLDLIPARSQEEMALPWPLFILGSICVYQKDQRTIQARYKKMTQFMGFGNIVRCMELLEEVWKSWNEADSRSCPSREAGQAWDERELGRRRWEELMAEKSWDLLLA